MKYFADFNLTLFPSGSPYQAVEYIICFAVSFKGNPKKPCGHSSTSKPAPQPLFFEHLQQTLSFSTNQDLYRWVRTIVILSVKKRAFISII